MELISKRTKKAVCTNCNTSGSFIDEYLRRGVNIFGLYFSSSIGLRYQSYDHIVNSRDGIHIELSKIGKSEDILINPSGLDPIESPAAPGVNPHLLEYSDGIISSFDGAKSILLRQVQFTPYDLTDFESDDQDQDVNAVIKNSSQFDRAYMQSSFKNAPMFDFQPNWFRPEVIINGKNILQGFSPVYPFHFAQNAIGLDPNVCFELNKEFENIQSIEVKGMLVQFIAESNAYKYYGLRAVLEFIALY